MDAGDTGTGFQEETYAVYLLDWTVVGGLQYVGMTTDLEARIATHRRAGTLPFRTLGEPEVFILVDGLDVYSAAARERRAIGQRRTMTPSGYNHSAGGEYSGARRDEFLSAAHIERLARATVAVANLDEKPHEADAQKLVAQGTGKVLEHYLAACSVVAGIVHQGNHPMKIGRKTVRFLCSTFAVGIADVRVSEKNFRTPEPESGTFTAWERAGAAHGARCCPEATQVRPAVSARPVPRRRSVLCSRLAQRRSRPFRKRPGTPCHAHVALERFIVATHTAACKAEYSRQHCNGASGMRVRPANEPHAMLTSEEQDALVSELAQRPGHEKVRVLLFRILVAGLGADSLDIDFEKPAPEVRGRIDALLGRTVFELKSDLRRERQDAEDALKRYLFEREMQTAQEYVGISTDGADFIAYFLRNERLVEVGAHHTEPERPSELLTWLRSSVSIGENLQPDRHTVTREFGRDSMAARRALGHLHELWTQASQAPDARLKRELWNRLLRVAYGVDLGDDALFLQHTYLVIVAKAVAWSAMIDVPPPDAASLLHGTAFSDRGIAGQSEPDFFDWVLAPQGGGELVMRIARQVNRFRLDDISTDILKALYESLIDPETRHYLGEYYTPDWLAARMIRAVVDRPLEQRVMDPACGSGTFLFHAVRAALAAAEESGVSPAEAVRRATDKVAGIDIHPVAVIFARATYLLALMPALRRGHPGSVTVPVYLGDALQWNLTQTATKGEQPSMLADSATLDIFVPAVTVNQPEPRRLDPAVLVFPAGIAAEAGLFDEVLTKMIELAGRSEPTPNFSAWMEHRAHIAQGDRQVLADTYGTLRELQEEGRNHVWGYVARNLARPVWLASNAQKADVVIGNPPWLAYRHMRGDFQDRYKKEATAARVWWAGRGTSGNDLAAYFFLRAALLYMRPEGSIAQVMPYAALSRRPYSRFRAGEVVRMKSVELRLRFRDTWTFGPKVAPLFPVPSCVLFATRHSGATPAELPESVRAFQGTLPRRDADEAEADATLTDTRDVWPAKASEEGLSPYRERFRQGAILIPRRLIMVEVAPATGVLPANPRIPLVRGRTGTQDKAPWKTLEPPQGSVDAEFVRTVLLGESIAPFRVIAPLKAVIPWDRQHEELLDAEGAASRGYSSLAKWLGRVEALWEEHGRGKRTLLEQYDFYGQLSCQFPISGIRVVYAKAGTNPAAAVIDDESAVIDHKLYWMAAANVEEARYLCGILNSEALRSKIKQYQSQGQFGARDFDKYVFNAPIPRFSDASALHRGISEVSHGAAAVSTDVAEREGEYFVTTRSRIRSVLAAEGIADRLEALVSELLRDNEPMGDW